MLDHLLILPPTCLILPWPTVTSATRTTTTPIGKICCHQRTMNCLLPLPSSWGARNANQSCPVEEPVCTFWPTRTKNYTPPMLYCLPLLYKQMQPIPLQRVSVKSVTWCVVFAATKMPRPNRFLWGTKW